MTVNFLLIVSGLSGSGKTTVGYEIKRSLPEINIVIIESDPIRKEIMGVKSTERLDSHAYTWEITEQVIKLIETRTKDALSKGCSVILTSTLTQESHRKDAEKLSLGSEAVTLGLWLNVPDDILKERVIKRTIDGNSESDATIDVLEEQLKYQREVKDWQHIDANRTVADITRNILHTMQNKGLISKQGNNFAKNAPPPRKM